MVILGYNLSSASAGAFNLSSPMLAEYKFQGENAVGAGVGGAPTYSRSYMTLLKTVVDGEPTIYSPTGDDTPLSADDRQTCLQVNQPDSFVGCPPFIDKMRCMEILRIIDTPHQYEAFWDQSEVRRREALYNMALACLLIVVILAMYTALSTDVTSMVVQPIESMVGLVKKLSENPNFQLEGQSKSKCAGRGACRARTPPQLAVVSIARPSTRCLVLLTLAITLPTVNPSSLEVRRIYFSRPTRLPPC